MSLRTFGLPTRTRAAKLNMQGNLALTQNEARIVFNALDLYELSQGASNKSTCKRASAKVRRALEIAEGRI